MTKLTGQQIAEEGLHGWAYLLGGLQTRIHTGNFATGLAIVNVIGAAAEDVNHHPDLNLRPGCVDVRLTSHDERGVTDLDVRLARAVTAIAADLNLLLDAASLSRLELAIDTPDHEPVLPFWAAVLAMEHVADPDFGDELRDPANGLPTIWFQKSGREEPRQRWHPDVWVHPAQVQPRIASPPPRIFMCGLRPGEGAVSRWIVAERRHVPLRYLLVGRGLHTKHIC
jgi:4a-hydroxytetrahydrobiopterin dehydratase